MLRIPERLIREGTDIKEGFTLDWNVSWRIVCGVWWVCVSLIPDGRIKLGGLNDERSWDRGVK